MKQILVKIGRGFVRACNILGRIFGSVEKVDEIYHALTPEAKAAAMKTFQDAAKTVVDAEAAGAAGGTNLVLDAQVIADVKQLYADAIADEAAAKKVFAALGITLPASSVSAVPIMPAA